LRHGLDDAELTDPSRRRGIPEDRHAGHVRCDLLEQLQPLSGHAVLDGHETRDVAAWPRQAVDEARADRIAEHGGHDRHGTGHLQQRPDRGGAVGQNHVRRERDQLCGVPANFGGVGRGPARVDPHIVADAPARLLQTLQEGPDACLKFRIVRRSRQ
jgi:hypothetical protein